MCFLTDSLQIIPDTWFTHMSIWGEPKCLGMRCKPCDRNAPAVYGGQGRNRTTDTRIFSIQFTSSWFTPNPRNTSINYYFRGFPDYE